MVAVSELSKKHLGDKLVPIIEVQEATGTKIPMTASSGKAATTEQLMQALRVVKFKQLVEKKKKKSKAVLKIKG